MLEAIKWGSSIWKYRGEIYDLTVTFLRSLKLTDLMIVLRNVIFLFPRRFQDIYFCRWIFDCWSWHRLDWTFSMFAATRAVELDISTLFYRVWCTGSLHKRTCCGMNFWSDIRHYFFISQEFLTTWNADSIQHEIVGGWSLAP